ncbi:hypothetical protein K2173_017220 [Erythroxylum novogranatense]|uniref:ENTH domain-containing protein n=1 Tax=Erythroxylum novogranatense TaxID=1862640 RepID=A0AAV8U9B4_9ROSI|nr:hypothetical protein K2173_017220 [Erythroxylum novogranatense]
MDFIKVFDQTVREIKREVNLKVLKVPEIEQKVLDATDDEPWGPHGTVLAEIAQATKKFTECQMVMNVLWTRLTETGKNWRLVYKALAVIEYLVAHGSERAVDDIIEHTFQISSLSSFEYAEPSGKDVGLNVRKKAENIVSLLNDKEKIQETRNKASANRDKYFGLSSTGLTYKSGSASYSGGSFQSSDRYGSSRESDYRDTYKDTDYYTEEKTDNNKYGRSRRGDVSSDQGNSKISSEHIGSKDQNKMSHTASKASVKPYKSDEKNSLPSQHSSALASNYGDDDDFDPRGTSATESAARVTNKVDLFGESLVGDLLDAPSVPAESAPKIDDSSETDLFADASFVSAPVQVEKGTSPHSEPQVDLFASQPINSSAVPSTIDFFSAIDPVVQPETKASKSASVNYTTVDPFAALPLNNFDGSDPFGAFTSNSNMVTSETTKSSENDGAFNILNGPSSTDSKSMQKKENFQVKSGVWADSLSRGIIDLNISAPKKVSLVGVGVVGDLSDGQDEMKKEFPATFYMGKAMGTGTGIGKSGFTSQASQMTGADDFFSNLGSQHYQHGSFKK